MASEQSFHSALAVADTTAQLCWTLDDARLFKTQVAGQGIQQVRTCGNMFIKYFRKLFTLRDGTPMVNEVDISFVENCKIASFALAGKGQFGTFDFDKSAHFNWKSLLAHGLSPPQLDEVLSSPIISVKLKPSQTLAALNQAHGRVACSKSVEWSINFGREDGTTVTLQPGLAGKAMKPGTHAAQSPALADRTRHRKIVGSAQIQADGTTFLYGGMEDDAWKTHLQAEMSSGHMQAIIVPAPLDPSTDPEILAVEAWFQCVLMTPTAPACFDHVPIHMNESGSSSSASPRLLVLDRVPVHNRAPTGNRYTVTTGVCATDQPVVPIFLPPAMTPLAQVNDTDLHQEFRASYIDRQDSGWTNYGWQNISDHSDWQNSGWGNSEWRNSGRRDASSHSGQWGSQLAAADQAEGSCDWRNAASDGRSF
jgi:hypothetical protein